ncbi:MAG: hypothetical protein ACK559_03915, partial [bacterium]
CTIVKCAGSDRVAPIKRQRQLRTRLVEAPCFDQDAPSSVRDMTHRLRRSATRCGERAHLRVCSQRALRFPSRCVGVPKRHTNLGFNLGIARRPREF